MTTNCSMHGTDVPATTYSRSDGGALRVRCKECHAHEERSRRAKNPEAYRAYQRAYRARRKGR